MSGPGAGPADLPAPRAISDESTVRVSVPPGCVQAGDAAVPAAVRLSPGTRVGRYLVIEGIGEGAMGLVYAAYDPELDRKIALKFLHLGGTGPAGTSVAPSPERRLLREAKALSHLSHPNVVAVHDVGQLGDQAFVAMELVTGTNLHQWALEKRRPWREVLEVYLQAGRGLTAAHAAGLVHRDFKPQNAVLGTDGRVRVLDFGLAIPRGQVTPHAPPHALDVPLLNQVISSDGWERLTQTGTVLGTPAYMAPEVIGGAGADEKSDQFSFCVSLFQGLYGCRPFEGATLKDIANAIASGRVREVGSGPVPGWLRKALLRGMAADPGQRFPSMDALLQTLERRDQASLRQRRWMAGSAVVLVVLGAMQVFNREAQLCKGADQELASVWNESSKKAVRAALLATGVPYAQDTWTRVSASLDGYTQAWATMHTDACLATHVRGEQSGELLDLRMRCLRQRLVEVKALVDALSRADASVVEKAASAANSMVAVSSCADEESLRAAVPLPADAVKRSQVESLHARLEQAHVLEQIGKYDESAVMLDGLEAEARALGYAPVVAEVLLLKAMLLADRGKYAEAVPVFESAAATGAQVKHPHVAALAERELVFVVGNHLQRFDEALIRAHNAEVVLGQMGLFDKLGDRLLHGLGLSFYRKGEMARAIEQLNRALELCTRSKPVEQCHSIIQGLGTAYYGAGRVDEGQARMAEAIAITERTLGATHPDLALAMNYYGLLLTDIGKYDQAMHWLTRALETYQHSLDQGHPLVAQVLNNLANVHWWRHEFDKGLAIHERVLQSRLTTLGPDHPDVATSYQNVGLFHESLGHLALARQYYQRCLELRTRRLGAQHEMTAFCRNNLASILIAEKNYPLAQVELEKVMEAWTSALGPQHPKLVYALLGLVDVAMAQQDTAKARSLLERALKIHEVNKVESTFTAKMHLQLANLLWKAPATRRKAVEHAHGAAAVAARLGGVDEGLRKDIQTWLQQHGE